MTRRLIVGLTGASGILYGVRALELLRALPDIETHAIISPSALQTLVAETDHTPEYVRDLAHTVHNFRDIGAAIASRLGHAYTPALMRGNAMLRAFSSSATSSARR